MMSLDPWKAATAILAVIVVGGGGVFLGTHLSSQPSRPVAAITRSPSASPSPKQPVAVVKPSPAHSSQHPKPATPPAPTCMDSCGKAEPVIFTAGSYSGTDPSAIYYSGDSGNIVTGINWSSWGNQTAIGYGTLGVDNCSPNCAQGTVTDVPATITLSNPIQGSPTIWGSMTESYDGQNASYSYPGTWALGGK